MSDNWAMDLAREVQVYSTTDFTHDCQEFIQDSPAPEWNSPPTASTSSSENDYIVQEFSLQQHRDDGYASCCSSTSSLLDEEEEGVNVSCSYTLESTDTQRKSMEIKRLKKNRKQRERELKKKIYIDTLKQIIIHSPLVDVKPKGSRKFTECDTLRNVKEIIEKLQANVSK